MYPEARDVPARPMYSTALKTNIVREQLNVRKWVYGRKFPVGFLDSGSNDSNNAKLQKLKSTLKGIMQEEVIKPPVKKPPLIRTECEIGPNPTAFRMSLGAERNQITTALEAEFIKKHPGGIWQGEIFICLPPYLPSFNPPFPSSILFSVLHFPPSPFLSTNCTFFLSM